MSASSPVLVAGAGPTGLYLALFFVRKGIPVRIIDKDLHHQLGSRGNGIHSRTMEIIYMLGLLPEIENSGLPPGTHTIYMPPRGEKILKQADFIEHVESTPNFPIMTGRVLGQNLHTRIVRAELAKHGVQVEAGKRIDAFVQDADGVTCDITVTAEDGSESKEQIRAAFLCGADGARSVVRKLLGCSFLGETKDADAIIVADVPVIQGEIDRLGVNMWSDIDQPGGINIVMMCSDKSSNLMTTALLGANFDIASIDLKAPGAIQRLFKQHVTREDIVMEEPVWLSYFRPSMRMVDSFGDKRVFVLGDAAHTHSPTGGQGMNSSIQDALNLSWKISLVYKHFASPSLLKTFTSERLPVIAQMLNKTSEIYKRWTDSKSEVSTGGRVHGRELFMLGVNYRWSEIVLDTRTPKGETEEALDALRAAAYGGHAAEEGQANIVAGDRAPDAPALFNAKNSQTTRLFDIFDLKRHTVLIFAPASSFAVSPVLDAISSTKYIPAEELQVVVLTRQPLDTDTLRSADYILTDTEGHAFGGYDIQGDELTVVVIRPDTYIGAIVKSPADMVKYFTQVFI